MVQLVLFPQAAPCELSKFGIHRLLGRWHRNRLVDGMVSNLSEVSQIINVCSMHMYHRYTYIYILTNKSSKL